MNWHRIFHWFTASWGIAGDCDCTVKVACGAYKVVVVCAWCGAKKSEVLHVKNPWNQ